VLLMVEVLKRELAGEPKFHESVEDLDSMRRSILDTVATMDRFLHAERFRQGKVQPHNTTVDVCHVLHDLSTQFTYQARDKGIELNLDIRDGVTTITDKDLLAMILQNLISNAVKYTPKGEVRVTADKQSDGAIAIAVIDQGPGIANDKLASLFDPFTRGETHGQPGVGLGLSIAHQAAELIGAKLTAESTLGQGSTFRLVLPAN
jgi:signal transduction histidine kinase